MALVDPSCSGSGGAGGHITQVHADGSVAAGTDEEVYWQRVRRLAASQRAIVLKALSFPKMRTVVYSTCSVHREENEDVVAAVLDAAGDTWQLARCLPEWPTRGLDETPFGALCVRAGAADLTHGFFVARFERRATSTTRPKRSEDSCQDRKRERTRTTHGKYGQKTKRRRSGMVSARTSEGL